MDFVVILVAAQGHTFGAAELARMMKLLERSRILVKKDPEWLSPKHAAEIHIEEYPTPEQIRAMRAHFSDSKIDVLFTPAQNRRKKMLVADMDSTIIANETLDELAALTPHGDKVEEITNASMAGEIEFEQALRERVALLKDLPVAKIESVIKNIKVNPGAKTLIQTMKKFGVHCVLVTGGFTQMSETVAETVGFDSHHANVLGINGGILNGTVEEPILGRAMKRTHLITHREELGLSPDDVIVLGDGANDLDMLEEAGIGVGYHAKPIIEKTMDNVIKYADLRAALYLQGYKDEDFFCPDE